MLKQNILYLAGKSIFVDLLGDVIYFPIWWYTVGLKHIVVHRAQSARAMSQHLALRLLVVNIFKPMFGQHDRAGRVISFLMRIVILIARAVFFVIYAVLMILFVILWIALPVIVVYRLLGIYIFPYVGF